MLKKLLKKLLKASQVILLAVVLLVGLKLIDDRPPTRTLDQEIKRIQLKQEATKTEERLQKSYEITKKGGI